MSTLLLSCLVLAGQQTEPQQMAWGDFDADGRLDVYVSHTSGDHLYRNVGGGEFEEIDLGFEDGSHLARWQDFDGDGKLDLYLASEPAPGRLLKNLGEGLFEDVTSGAGLPVDLGRIEDARWFDFDDDQAVDLLLTGKAGSQLLRNDGNAVFQPVEIELRTRPATAVAQTFEVADEETTTDDSTRPVAARSSRVAVRSPRSDAVPHAPGKKALAAPAPSASSGVETSVTRLFCAQTVHDQGSQSCIGASSNPTLGMLYPLSTDLFVDSTGYIGMGTSNPDYRLHVNGSIRAELDVLAGYGTSTAPAFRFGPGLEQTGLSSPDSEELSLITSGVEAVRIRSNGRVGIGTQVPASPLNVVANDEVAVFAEVIGASSNTIATGLVGTLNTGAYMGGAGVSGSARGTGIFLSSGVDGYAGDPDRNDVGVNGRTRSESIGVGVWGTHLSVNGIGAGVEGVTNSVASDAVGVHGVVVQTTPGSFSAAVYGENRSTTTNGIGVYGFHQGNGLGVNGAAFGPSGIGVQGSGVQWGVLAFGDLGALGTKSFVQPHPTDAAKEVRFVCLEGNESGTYFRGSSRLVNGAAVIEVPEEFRLVSEPEGLTVQTTAVGRPVLLWIESQDLERIVVRGDADCEFNYFVNGVRRGFADFETIRPNTSFVPAFEGEPYAKELPTSLREILVGNGTLNPDFTPNAATAARLGWQLRERPEPLPEVEVPQVIERPNR